MTNFNPGSVWNKARPRKLTAEQKRGAKAGQNVCGGYGWILPSGATVFFNKRLSDGTLLRGFWVKSYASSGVDSAPYCL